jgi:molybdenum cofactor synthesis domain-containing protein
MYKVGIITTSDRGFTGLRNDESGPLIKKTLEETGKYTVEKMTILPDDEDEIVDELILMINDYRMNLILTTGGTGLSKRDRTPEATFRVITREVPGIAEAIRYHSLSITPRAMMSRGIAGTKNKTLIINLPGSPKAVRECLEYLLQALDHGLDILTGSVSDCGHR